LVFIFLLSFPVYSGFDDNACLKANFEATVVHKASFFGLFKRVLKVSKQGCILSIEHVKFKFIKKKWLIDVCRTPAHIKAGSGSVEVLKRTGICLQDAEDSDFCHSLILLEQVMQDDGLIFADGEKEDLKSEHGRVYCSYLLIETYLRKGLVFSKGGDYKNILEKKLLEIDSNKEIKLNVVKKEDVKEPDKSKKTGEF